MIRNFFLLMGVIVSATLSAQTAFPTITCSRLDQSSSVIPNISGKKTVLLISFGKKGSDDVATWIDPLVQKFIRKSGMLDQMFDANLFALTFVNAAEWSVIRSQETKIKADLPTELHSNVLYSQDNAAVVAAALGEKSKNTATVVLLDEHGQIVKLISGAFTENKLEALEEGFD